MSSPVADILSTLREYKSLDPKPGSGRLFSYLYETGDPELARLASEAYRMFLDTNALDPTVFKSALALEREVVGFSKSLVHAGDDVVGTVTYGGTESIILALTAAREWYRRRRHGVPRVVVPVTGHPSIRKAAWLLGMRVVEAPVDPESKRADPEAVKELVDDDTALVVLSAPSYPYGVVDPVRDVAEYTSDRDVLLHVDACVGGFILPFMEMLGERVEPYDFRVDGVTSLSMDAHKYGYTPKGASILLFRGGELKEGTVYVDLEWPGYPFINTTILSSRTAAPLAAAWAVFQYLGVEGYKRLAARVLEARDRILDGMRRLGFRSLAPVESPLLSLALDSSEDTIRYHASMSLKGWIIGLQPPLEGVAPYNIHLTITPVHHGVVDEFIEDSRRSLAEPPPRELLEAYRLLEEDPLRLASMVGETPVAGAVIALLLASIPADLAVEMARKLTVEVFKG